MSAAENQETGSGTPSAGGQEHFIPKHRFDELTARLRQTEEALTIKDQIINQSLAARQPAVQDEPAFNAEELGVDPQVAQAAAKIAKTLVSHELGKATKQVNSLIGTMGTELERTKFLLNYGKDKQDYLPKIQEQQQRHFQMTGQYMDTETAYKLVRFDENERAAARRPADPPAPAAAAAAPATAAAPAPASAGPSAAATRVNPGPAAPGGAAKSFNDLTPEEMEARLEEAFKEGQSV